MKKIYTMIAAFAVVLSANAQNKVNLINPGSFHHSTADLQVHPLATGERAPGDTLMWLPSPGVYLLDAVDQTDFDLTIEDIDGLTPNNAGEDMDWGLYYSVNTEVNGMGQPTSNNFYHPWEDPLAGDTTFFWHATSWFAPPGTSDNWFIMGPITLPAGATLLWYDRTNPAYRDGYKIFVQGATSVSTPPTFSDFTGTAVYTKTSAYPSPTYATDTTWVMRTATVPAMYAAQRIFVAIQHNAPDMDVLYIDEFTVVDALVGIEENSFVNGIKVHPSMPNPTSGVSTIAYELKENAAITLNVYDVTGKLIASQYEGEQIAGARSMKFDASDLTAGVYYYTLSIGSKSSASQKIVVIK